MTGESSWFIKLQQRDKGKVQFADGTAANVKGIGSIGKDSNLSIDKVMLVDKLTHNLLSVSQFCDLGLNVLFNKQHALIFDPLSSNIKIVGH